MSRALTYCGNFARNNDPDRFFLTLFAPEMHQRHLWALLAFNQEIAKTRDVVTDTTIGLIRLQWWRDAVKKIYENDGAQGNDVLNDLEKAIKTYSLPQDQFETLIYAREFDVEDRPPANLEGLTNYADYTNTPLINLCLRVLQKQEESRDLAIGYGLAGLLRSVLFHARHRRCYLPADLLEEKGISLNALYDLKPSSGLNEIIQKIAGAADTFLASAHPSSPFTKGMKKLAEIHLKRMKKCGYDPFKPAWVHPPPFWHLRVALAAR